MIMEEDEAVGGLGDDGTEDIARVGDGLVDGAGADFVGGEVSEACIEKSDEEFFLAEPGELGGEVLMDFFRRVEDGLGEGFPGGAAAEFEGCGELAGFGEAESREA